jgi:hypothetical protein
VLLLIAIVVTFLLPIGRKALTTRGDRAVSRP